VLEDIFFRILSRIKRIQKTSEFDRKLLKASKFTNIQSAKDLVIKYPNEPRASLLLAERLFKNHEEKFLDELQTYNIKRKKYLQNSRLDEEDFEFIKPNIFCGALGVYFHLFVFINSMKIGLKKNKKIYCMMERNKFTNKYFSKFFDDKLIKFFYKKRDTIQFIEKEKNLFNPIGFCQPLDNFCYNTPFTYNILLNTLIKNEKNFSYFSIPDRDKQLGKDTLEKLGIPNNAWYVTCHIREPGWSGEDFENSNQMIRNADPKTYYKAFKFIREVGGYVIRVGNNYMKKLDKIENVIDYAHSDFKSEFMDVFLGATSKFSIVTSSGYSSIPATFGVPILHTNQLPTSAVFQCNLQDLYLPKLISKNHKILSIDDTYIPNYTTLTDDSSFKKFGLSFTNNTDDEILQATKEMFRMVFENRNYDDENSEIKKQISNNFKKHNLRCRTNFSPYFIKKHYKRSINEN
tara:strand:+ start:203 stop:1585 length:1383 start_codon:yes stop_codon:yes gene_type:complete